MASVCILMIRSMPVSVDSLFDLVNTEDIPNNFNQRLRITTRINAEGLPTGNLLLNSNSIF